MARLVTPTTPSWMAQPQPSLGQKMRNIYESARMPYYSIDPKVSSYIPTVGGGAGGGGGSVWSPSPQGQVLGGTSQAPQSTLPPAPTPSGPSEEELARQRYEAETRAAIESGYSDYMSQLDAMLSEGLPAQQAAQRGIVESQYQQGVSS